VKVAGVGSAGHVVNTVAAVEQRRQIGRLIFLEPCPPTVNQSSTTLSSRDPDPYPNPTNPTL